MIFLVLGLFIGIATIVTLLSITESMSRDIEDRLDQFGANIVMVPRARTCHFPTAVFPWAALIIKPWSLMKRESPISGQLNIPKTSV